VHENIFAPIVGGDVAKAFRLVEPLDLAFEVGGGGRGAHGAGGDGECGRVRFVCLSVRILERKPEFEDIDERWRSSQSLSFVGRLHVLAVVERVFKSQRSA
jgi:hypothetical protein